LRGQTPRNLLVAHARPRPEPRAPALFVHCHGDYLVHERLHLVLEQQRHHQHDERTAAVQVKQPQFLRPHFRVDNRIQKPPLGVVCKDDGRQRFAVNRSVRSANVRTESPDDLVKGGAAGLLNLVSDGIGVNHHRAAKFLKHPRNSALATAD
jgi:hypothetical protein